MILTIAIKPWSQSKGDPTKPAIQSDEKRRVKWRRRTPNTDWVSANCGGRRALVFCTITNSHKPPRHLSSNLRLDWSSSTLVLSSIMLHQILTTNQGWQLCPYPKKITRQGFQIVLSILSNSVYRPCQVKKGTMV